LEQAAAVASCFDEEERPELVVTSPYIRARETAAPLCEKLQLKADVWPVQEWTFLDTTQYSNTTHDQRLPAVQAFFDRADPIYVEGGESESFASLVGRIDTFLKRLQTVNRKRVVVFTHGYFIKALVWRLSYRGSIDASAMRSFLRLHSEWVLNNGSITTLYRDGNKWVV
jgi:broad specificity phosphatase PhoE